MAKKLCKSHVTALQKVATQLAYKQTMQYTTLLVSRENNDRMQKAEQLIYEAMQLLNQVQ